MIINHPFRIRDPDHATKLELPVSVPQTGKDTACASMMRTKFLRTSHKHVCPSASARNVVHRHDLRQKRFGLSDKQDQSAVQDSIDCLIDVSYTQTLAEDQIEDTCEHEYSKQLQLPWPHSLSETAILLIVTHFSLSTL